MCFSDINECGEKTNCHINATCLNTVGSYKCFCNQGFRGDGNACQSVVMETFKESLDKYLDFIIEKVIKRLQSKKLIIDMRKSKREKRLRML